MEVKVDALIKQIKDQGISEAKKEADIIISEAKKEADKLVYEAKRKAEKLLSDAEKTNSANKQSTLSSLEHAKRDVLLSLKSDIDNLFNDCLKKEIKESLTNKEFTENLIKVLTNDIKDVKVEYNSNDFNKIKKYIDNKLVDKLIKEKRICINNDVLDGFNIIEKNNKYYVDCSSEEVSKLLLTYIKESK